MNMTPWTSLTPQSIDFSWSRLVAPSSIAANVRWLWSTSQRVDNIWYELRNPRIAAVQEFVNCHLQDSEYVQFFAALAVVANRCLQVIEIHYDLNYHCEGFRRTWSIWSWDYRDENTENRLLDRAMAKYKVLGAHLAFILMDGFRLVMTILDAREAFVWDEERRKERVKSLVADIAKTCEAATPILGILRTQTNRLDWCLRWVGAPCDSTAFIVWLQYLRDARPVCEETPKSLEWA